MSKLPIEWTANIPDDKDKETFEQTIRNSVVTLSRLQELIDKRLSALDTQEMSPKDFDTPSWAFKQAHRSGRRQGLNEIRELISFIN